MVSEFLLKRQKILIVICVAIFFMGVNGFAVPTWRELVTGRPPGAPPEISVVSATTDTTTLNVIVPGYWEDEVTTLSQTFTRIFLPEQIPAAGVPAILERTPYRFPEDAEKTEFFNGQGEFFSGHGYAYVLQDCRGRFASQGIFEPYHEQDDGYQTTEWIVAQPWSNGDIGTFGGSYSGYTALAAAAGNPYVRVVIADDAPASQRYGFHGGIHNCIR